MGLVITSDFNVLGSSSNLVVVLRLDVWYSFPSIEFVTSLFEVVFHHVNILVVVRFVHAGVSDHADAEQVEALSYSLTFEESFRAEFNMLSTVLAFSAG